MAKVIIDLEHYNELRDFRAEILKGKIYTIFTYNHHIADNISFFTESEAIEILNKEIKHITELHNDKLDLEYKIKKLEEKIKELEYEKTKQEPKKNKFRFFKNKYC